jgi:hypothetical protein
MILTGLEAVERDLLRKRLPLPRHSYTYPKHECTISNLARFLGFTYLLESAQLLPMITMALRGVSSADTYHT